MMFQPKFKVSLLCKILVPICIICSLFFTFSFAIFAQPKPTEMTDEELVHYITGSDPSATRSAVNHNFVRESLSTLRNLVEEMKSPARDLIAIENAIAEGRTGTRGTELGIRAGVGLLAGAGAEIMLGTHQRNGRRWLHLRLGSRVHIPNESPVILGFSAGIHGRRYSNTQNITPGFYRTDENGIHIGIGGYTGKTSAKYYPKSNIEEFHFGIGLSVLGSDHTEVAGIGIPLIPLGRADYARRIQKLNKLKMKIAFETHNFKFSKAYRYIEEFKKQLASLKDLMTPILFTPIAYESVQLSPLDPFSSPAALFEPSHIVEVEKRMDPLARLIAACQLNGPYTASQ